MFYQEGSPMKKSTKSALVVLIGIVICSLAFTIIKSEQTTKNNTTIKHSQNDTAVELPAAAALPNKASPNLTPTAQIKDTPYKCSDFDPKTGGLKGWTADMGVGPAIPEQLLPKDCPALNH